MGLFFTHLFICANRKNFHPYFDKYKYVHSKINLSVYCIICQEILIRSLLVMTYHDLCIFCLGLKTN